jgi:hypothetical protein
MDSALQQDDVPSVPRMVMATTHQSLCTDSPTAPSSGPTVDSQSQVPSSSVTTLEDQEVVMAFRDLASLELVVQQAVDGDMDHDGDDDDGDANNHDEDED